MARPARDEVERFLEKVNISGDGCYLWLAQVKRDGYGRFSFRGKNTAAHKVSWLLFHGEIPQGKCVLHRCDVRTCVNPEHLFLGSTLDNVKDMDAKGRRGTCQSVPTHRVPEIFEFVENGATQQEIAEFLGVHQTTISRILLGKAKYSRQPNLKE